jgi:hypothetical protein
VAYSLTPVSLFSPQARLGTMAAEQLLPLPIPRPQAMTFHLILVMAAFIPKTESQERVRELENSLRQFPAATAVSKNAALSRQYVRRLDEVSVVIPVHRRDAYAKQLHDAKRLWVVWHSLDRAKTLLKEAKSLADQGKMDTRGRNMAKTAPELVYTVPELLEEAERYIRILEGFLGEESFSTGRMPPPVPYWHFQWID